MRKGIALVIGAAGVAALSYVWAGDEAPRSSARSATTKVTGTQTAALPEHPVQSTTVNQEASEGARVFSARNPLLAPSEHLPEQPLTAPEYIAPGGRWVSISAASEDASTPRQRGGARRTNPGTMSSAKPGDAEARQQLVRDIQYELRRVGCYAGDVHGSWSPSTRKSMKAFTDEVNATLPVEEPDYILLTLVQGHKGGACGTGCPAGQAAAADGRCVPRAVLAQQPGRPQGPVDPDAERAEMQGRMTVGVLPGGDGERRGSHDGAPGAGARTDDGYLRPFTSNARPQTQNKSRSGYAARGSTRRVFANTAGSAP